ncbi:MAG: hypothetical protein AB1465_01145 [Patescibacteria group bacterium]
MTKEKIIRGMYSGLLGGIAGIAVDLWTRNIWIALAVGTAVTLGFVLLYDLTDKKKN